MKNQWLKNSAFLKHKAALEIWTRSCAGIYSGPTMGFVSELYLRLKEEGYYEKLDSDRFHNWFCEYAKSAYQDAETLRLTNGEKVCSGEIVVIYDSVWTVTRIQIPYCLDAPLSDEQTFLLKLHHFIPTILSR